MPFAYALAARKYDSNQLLRHPGHFLQFSPFVKTLGIVRTWRQKQALTIGLPLPRRMSNSPDPPLAILLSPSMFALSTAQNTTKLATPVEGNVLRTKALARSA